MGTDASKKQQASKQDWTQSKQDYRNKLEQTHRDLGRMSNQMRWTGAAIVALSGPPVLIGCHRVFGWSWPESVLAVLSTGIAALGFGFWIGSRITRKPMAEIEEFRQRYEIARQRACEQERAGD